MARRVEERRESTLFHEAVTDAEFCDQMPFLTPTSAEK